MFFQNPEMPIYKGVDDFMVIFGIFKNAYKSH